MSTENTNTDTDGTSVQLPGIESFDNHEDARPSREVTTVRFDNGARWRYALTDGQEIEEVYRPDDTDEPSYSRAVDISSSGNGLNAAEYVVDVLIEYEAYRPTNDYDQLRSDWGYTGFVAALADAPETGNECGSGDC